MGNRRGEEADPDTDMHRINEHQASKKLLFSSMYGLVQLAVSLQPTCLGRAKQPIWV